MIKRSGIMLILFLVGCQKEQIIQLSDGTEALEVKYPNVEQTLWPYFQMFETEGAKRGILIDLVEEGIMGHIAHIDDGDVIGQCRYSHFQPNQVTIDHSFWNNASDAYKELVVFHELGHCYLWRDHNDTAINGVCQSIMHSGGGGCRTLYNARNRSTYIDELFSESNRPDAQ